MNKLAELAAKTVVCPGCGGKGQVAYPWFAPCPTCKGKGQVALIEGLQVPPQYGDVQDWTVVDEEKAFYVMVQWATSERHWLISDRIYGGTNKPVVTVKSLQGKEFVGEADTFANALADAILQVVES